MKGMGWLLLGVGATLLLYALAMDTSVVVGGAYGGPQRVQNLSLMDMRRTYLMVAIGALVIGTMLVGFSRLGRDTEDSVDHRACPFCAEQVRVEAIICKHCRSELPAVDPVDPAHPETSEVIDEDGDERSEEDERSYSYRALREAAEAAEAGGAAGAAQTAPQSPAQGRSPRYL